MLMHNYLDLLEELLAHGKPREDCTGTGTLGLFGQQLRFDLREGFPLLTTKKVWWRGVVEELLWFLSGSTNINDLDPQVRKWWTAWAGEDGSLGAIYGQQLRHSRWYQTVKPLIFTPPDVVQQEGLFAGVGHLDNTKKTHCNDEIDDILKNVWRDMIRRCYDPRRKSYKSYGAKGYHVCKEWLHYPAFKADAQNLIGWNLKRMFPSDYSLDKDILCAANRYGPNTCMWASHVEQSMNTSTVRPFTAVSPEGKTISFVSIGEATRKYGLNLSAVHRCLNGGLKTHHGWSSFTYIESRGTLRFREVDQVRSALANLKYSPDSRRILMNLWHSPAMDHANLPCCHGSVIQFNTYKETQSGVSRRVLSCHMYQRSADYLLGVPVNIASYALLTHMFAHVLGYDVGELIITFGDVHLYKNHIEQAKLQLSREPRALPTLRLNPSVDELQDFEYNDFVISDYCPHPVIKAPVSV